MAKAIPVFKFVFAAYAASCAGAARECREVKARRSGRQTGFVQNWSVLSSDGGLTVKIGVRDSEPCQPVAEPRGLAGDYCEVWLGEIRETAHAFSGVVRRAEPALRHIRPGQIISFDPTHILDWASGEGAKALKSGVCAEKALCEIVGS